MDGRLLTASHCVGVEARPVARAAVCYGRRVRHVDIHIGFKIAFETILLVVEVDVIELVLAAELRYCDLHVRHFLHQLIYCVSGGCVSPWWPVLSLLVVGGSTTAVGVEVVLVVVEVIPRWSLLSLRRLKSLP